MRKTRQQQQQQTQQCSDQHQILWSKMTPPPTDHQKGRGRKCHYRHLFDGGPRIPPIPRIPIGVKNEDNNEAGTRAPKLSAGHLL